MNDNPLQNLISIDQAIRLRPPSSTPGRTEGLAELIRRDPEIEVWLSWLCEASQQRTCGAIEEVAHDRELMSPQTPGADTSIDSGGGASSGGGGGLSLVLVGPDGDPVPPTAEGVQHLRFSVVASGNYRLFTADRTLLWSQAMSGTNQSLPPDIWRLAAAPVEDPIPSEDAAETADSDPPASNAPHTRIQRWALASWAMTVALSRSGSRTWLDITQQ